MVNLTLGPKENTYTRKHQRIPVKPSML